MVDASVGTISKLETGRGEPSEGLLRALCEVLDVTESFFARPVDDEYASHECSFRHLQSTPKKLLEETLARGSLHHESIRRLSDLVEFPHPNIPNIPASDPEGIEAAAAQARVVWGLGESSPILNVIRVAEHAGVIVTRLRGTTQKVDAFSRYGNPPIIALTSVKGSTSLDRYNVAHELGHLVIHRDQETGNYKTEREANRFADALLLPAPAFASEFQALRPVEWPQLFELKRRWGVLGSRILRRAEDLQLISAVAARRLYKQHSWRGWNKREPHEPPQESPELLDVAFEVATEDWGKDLGAVATDLGWGDRMVETIFGRAIQRTPPPPPPNVRSIADYYTRKEKAR